MDYLPNELLIYIFSFTGLTQSYLLVSKKWDISKFSILDLSNNQIVNIEPLSILVNLRELYLYNNQIVNVKPLSTLINLRKLYPLNLIR